MRVVYKKSIVERIYDEKHFAASQNKTIEYIYLDKPEWYELLSTVTPQYTTGYYPYPKRVAIREPLRIAYIDPYRTVMPYETHYTTEEIEFMGIKVRLEYK